MKVITKVNGSNLEVAVEGSLDTMTAPEFEEKMNGSLDGIKDILFDFAKLDYISSAGLRILITLQKKMNKLGSMKIINANEIVMEIFEVTGFVEILNIE